ncbi:MAG: hypothetical protein WBV73_25345 [Phormidium sp.]
MSSINTSSIQKILCKLPLEIWVLIFYLTVSGYIVFRSLSDHINYQKAEQAYRNLNCSVAVSHFDQVIYQWRFVDVYKFAARSQQKKSQCLEFMAAFNQQQSGNFHAALVGYNNFLHHYGKHSYLTNAVKDKMQTLLTQTTSENSSKEY